MTWSEAQAKLTDTDTYYTFRAVASKRVLWVKVSVVGIFVGGTGAGFVCEGSDTVTYDATSGLFATRARAQASNAKAVALHTAVAKALGLVS